MFAGLAGNAFSFRKSHKKTSHGFKLGLRDGQKWPQL
jgi:hypothetical protein